MEWNDGLVVVPRESPRQRKKGSDTAKDEDGYGEGVMQMKDGRRVDLETAVVST